MKGSNLTVEMNPTRDSPIRGWYHTELDQFAREFKHVGICVGLVPCEFFGYVFELDNGELWDSFVPIDKNDNEIIKGEE